MSRCVCEWQSMAQSYRHPETSSHTAMPGVWRPVDMEPPSGDSQCVCTLDALPASLPTKRDRFCKAPRLTAYEFQKAGVPVTVISDNMAGHLMARGEIQSVIVGADRIAKNGDVANKIGTYSLAVLAKAHGIPFFVAAPRSTLDPKRRRSRHPDRRTQHRRGRQNRSRSLANRSEYWLDIRPLTSRQHILSPQSSRMLASQGSL